MRPQSSLVGGGGKLVDVVEVLFQRTEQRGRESLLPNLREPLAKRTPEGCLGRRMKKLEILRRFAGFNGCVENPSPQRTEVFE